MARKRNSRSETELAELRDAGRRRAPLEALRARCLDCCGGSAVEVEQCPAKACPSWPYRYGIDPWLTSEMPAKAEPEPKAADPVPAAPVVEVAQMQTAARRTWRQHHAIYVDTRVNTASVNAGNSEALGSAANARGRGDDAADVVATSAKVAAPAVVKRKRGRPRKQPGLFDE